MTFIKKYIFILFLIIFSINISVASENNFDHAISVFNEIKYKKNFKHFDYVNPNAPKKGLIKLAERGTFDSLNQFVLKGLPAIGLDNIYESLLVTSLDEPLTAYGLIAKSIKVSKDKASITFFLNQNAKWHDNKPITSHDIEWTFNTILKLGHPSYRSYYRRWC